MEHREGPGSVEVVVERVGEAVPGEIGRPRRADAEGLAEVVGLGARRLHGDVGVLKRAPVVPAEEEDEDGLAPPSVERLAKRDDIADGLRHLLGAELDHAVVHPGAGERAPGAPGLGELVFVVGEAQIESAAVDVEPHAQVLFRHRRALDVPARPPPPPGRIPPSVLGRLPGLPQREVPRILLERSGLLYRHVLGARAREPTVVPEARHAEVHVAPRFVGEPAGDELPGERDDVRDGLGGERLDIGTAEAEAVGVLHIPAGGPAGELDAADPEPPRGVVDLVVDVGDVLHERHPVAAELEPPAEPHRQDEGAGIADVDALVHGRAAEVHADRARRGREIVLPPRVRVVQLDQGSARAGRPCSAGSRYARPRPRCGLPP